MRWTVSAGAGVWAVAAMAMTAVAGGQTATVTGAVTMGGVPVKGALVSVASADTAVVTNKAGAFLIAGLRPGADTLIVEHVGSEQIRVPVQLDAGVTRSVPIAVSLPTAVDTVDIDAVRLRNAYASVGFDTRRQGGTGTFLDQAQIEKRSPSTLGDLLRTVPGFRVRYVGGRTVIEGTRGTNKCVAYYVDRLRYHPMRPVDVYDVVHPRQIAAVEAYPGIAPAEFSNHQGCATVVIWTKTRLGVL
jgi:hypothetical protein